jgi:death-on-curing family protein
VIEFLTVEVVIALHQRQLERFGGGAGLRDRGLVESAVAQPQASFGGTYVHEGLFAMAAAYLFHIVSNHPFVDGNKRAGLLAAQVFLDLNGITLEHDSEHWKLLTKPLLYLSLFFKRHREDYYRRLNAVRVDGDWEGWLDFFLDGVATIADEAVASARELFALVASDRTRVLAQEGMSIMALKLFELLPSHPVVTVASAMRLVNTTKPTAGRAIELLVAGGVLVETTGKKRDRSFVYQAYLDRLRTGTEIDEQGQRRERVRASLGIQRDTLKKLADS